MRWPSRPRLRRWPSADRPAVLHQWSGAEIRPGLIEAATRGGTSEHVREWGARSADRLTRRESSARYSEGMKRRRFWPIGLLCMLMYASTAYDASAEWYVAGQFGVNFADRLTNVNGTNG